MYLNYLAYGSNLHPHRLRARVPSARVVNTVELTGWQLRFHKRSIDDSAKCNLVYTANVNDRAWGAVYEIAFCEKPALDQAEGLGIGYSEASIAINGIGEVFFYTASTEWIDENLLPYCWYHNFVVDGARYHRFPHTYIERLQRQPFIIDEDLQRRSLNQAILLTAS